MKMVCWVSRLLLFAAGMMTAPVLAQDVIGVRSEEQSPDTPGNSYLEPVGNGLTTCN